MLSELGGRSLAVEVDMADGIATVRPHGDLDLCVRDALADRLAKVAEKNPDLLVIDLAGVTFLDCGTAAVIFSMAQQMPSGRKPILRSACPLVRRV